MHRACLSRRRSLKICHRIFEFCSFELFICTTVKFQKDRNIWNHYYRKWQTHLYKKETREFVASPVQFTLNNGGERGKSGEGWYNTCFHANESNLYISNCVLSIPWWLHHQLLLFFLLMFYWGCHSNNPQGSLDPRWREKFHLFGT